MSNRGSFVTEYIYCPKCFEVMKNELTKEQDKYLYTVQVEDMPILAGKVGGHRLDEEYIKFEHEIKDNVKELLCHNVKVSVLPEMSEPIIVNMKDEEKSNADMEIERMKREAERWVHEQFLRKNE